MKQNQGGKYVCIVTQEYGKNNLIVQEIEFDVEVSSPPTFIHSSSEIIDSKFGENKTLICEVKPNYETIFMWFHKDMPIVNQQIINFNFQSRLTIKVNSIKNCGIYTCKAFNDYQFSLKEFIIRAEKCKE
jgi:hypothetical protein